MNIVAPEAYTEQITTFANVIVEVVICVRESDSNADKRDRLSSMSQLSCKKVGGNFHHQKI